MDLGILCTDEHEVVGGRREDLEDLPEGVLGMNIIQLVAQRMGGCCLGWKNLACVR